MSEHVIPISNSEYRYSKSTEFLVASIERLLQFMRYSASINNE